MLSLSGVRLGLVQRPLDLSPGSFLASSSGLCIVGVSCEAMKTHIVSSNEVARRTQRATAG